MTGAHSLKPLWIGVACMAVGVGLIYWAFHSGEPSAVPPSTDDDAVCAQVITWAKDPWNGEIIGFPTPCDVPEGWEVIQPDVAE